MGSISSPPKAPQPTVIYQSAPQPSAPTPSVPTAAETASAQAAATSSARKSDLLRRSRGRLGTIYTGFRGLVNSVSQGANTARKTLLGE